MQKLVSQESYEANYLMKYHQAMLKRRKSIEKKQQAATSLINNEIIKEEEKKENESLSVKMKSRRVSKLSTL